MKPTVLMAVLTVGIALPPPPVQTQQLEARGEVDAIHHAYQALDRSIVRIRTSAELERRGDGDHPAEPLLISGTGLVVGKLWAEGRWEYLVLTNHHVADISNYVIEENGFLRENKSNTRAVPRVPEQSWLVDPESVTTQPDDIQLIEVARDVRGDMALLRTVGADRDLPVAEVDIGYRPGELQPGERVITSGFPDGGDKVRGLGQVVEVGRAHELGQPHADIMVDIPVRQGQSGSPVFRVQTRGDGAETEVRFTLVGLVHATEHGEFFVTPYSLWRDSMARVEGTLLQRMVW